MSSTIPSVGETLKREKLQTIRSYLEIVVILALSYALYQKDNQVTKLQEKLYQDTKEGLQYWRELNDKSADLRESSRSLREWEDQLKERERALKKPSSESRQSQ